MQPLPPPTASRKLVDKDLIEQAIDDIKNNNLSIRKAAKKHGIAYTNLHNHLTKYEGYITSFGRAPALTPEEEDSLHGYLVFMAEAGYPLTKKVLRHFATQVIKNSGREITKNLLSAFWARSFIERHQDLTIKKAHAITEAIRSVPQSDYDEFYSLLEKELEHVDQDPSRVFNMDETGFGGKSRGSGSRVCNHS